MSAWHEGHIVALDTETSGKNPLEDRIVTAAVVHVPDTGRPRIMQWIIDPEVEIHPEAAAIHGWTNERIAATVARPGLAVRITNGNRENLTREGALFEIAAQCATAMGTNTPLVVHNAAYDLTLLEAELARHGIDPLSSRPSGIRGVVDPMVIEKQFDPYRKVCYKAPGCDREKGVHECGGCRGSRQHHCGGCGATDKKLLSLCAHYGIIHGGAHDAAADALAAARLADKLAAAWPATARLRLATLHTHQAGWKRDQSDSLRAFWEKQGDPRAAEVDSGWPLHTQCAPARAEVAS